MKRARFRMTLATAASFLLTLPAAHGAGIDLHHHGLTGSWYDPTTSGQGIAVEVYPDLLSPGSGIVQASWFTFDAVAGGAERQRWYTLSGPVASGQTEASLTIYRNTGGNFNAPPITTAQPVGSATLRFDSCISGQLTYSFTDGSGRASTIPLTRLLRDVTCSTVSERHERLDFGQSGNWYDAATSGQGISLEVNPVSKVIFFAWQTYAPNGAGAGPAGQRWYTGQGAIDLYWMSFPIQLYETTGGRFDANSEPTTIGVGSATFAFQDCERANLSFSFTGGSSIGIAGTIPLVRVGPLPSTCWGPWDY